MQVIVVTTADQAIHACCLCVCCRLIPRLQQWAQHKRDLISARYRKFVKQVEQKSLLMAKILPHAVYWTVVALLVFFAPQLAVAASQGPLWQLVTIAYPVCYTMYLLRSKQHIGASPTVVTAKSVTQKSVPGRPILTASTTATAANNTAVPFEPHDTDKALMYWVVFAIVQCCVYAISIIPGSSMLSSRWKAHIRVM
jgi:hypothetical protein